MIMKKMAIAHETMSLGKCKLEHSYILMDKNILEDSLVVPQNA
jgi:hypothetical protein